MNTDELFAAISRALEGLDIEELHFDVQESTEYLGIKDGEIEMVSLNEGHIRDDSNYLDRMDVRKSVHIRARAITKSEYVAGHLPEEVTAR